MRLASAVHKPGHWCIALVLAAAVCAVVVPANAFACSVEEGKHCYAIEDWHMQGSPAEIMGAKAEEVLAPSYVPNWGSEFLDDEMWVAFPQMNSEAWVEAGATVGWPYSPTEPHYFHARSYGPKKYNEAIYPTGPGYYNWFSYYLDEPYGHNGEWCITFGWESSPNQCWANFGKSSQELQAGLEFATTTSSGAYNATVIQGWEQWMSGTWVARWESPWNHPFAVLNSPLCLDVPAPERDWGSVAASVGAERGCG
jgi:hypothetical protein